VYTPYTLNSNVFTLFFHRKPIASSFLSAFSYRSDIPVQGILPHQAQGFQLTKGATILGTNLEKTIKMLESDGYDLVMVDIIDLIKVNFLI
jgi:hypothetical protein